MKDMEAPVNFGKRAEELARIKALKQKKMKRIIRIFVLIAAISIPVIFWSDITNAVASSGSKSKKLKNETEQSDDNGKSLQVSPGVSVTQKWDLPKVLTEISGISHIADDRFACVQDELGTLFIYNTATSKIEKEISFAAPGDYEGLAMVNETAWVVRADGVLFEVNHIGTAKPVVTEYKTHLTAQQNVEGLCYDKQNNRLLLAIKDDEPGEPGYKGVYAFDLATRKMPKEPVIKIALNHELFKTLASSKKKAATIMPSSIAIHPVTSDIYITDGRKAKLLVMDAGGTIKKLYHLATSEFAQPEGITFKPGGEMFITNEGPKQPGNILRVELTTP